MVMMVPHEAFACTCGAGDVVLRESYRAKPRGKLYYACPKSKPRLNYYGCGFFLWKDERVRQLISSPGASTTSSFSPRTSSTPSFSPTPSTPPNYYGGSSSNTECSNCKHLLGRIKVLQATLEMYMHPEQHTLHSTALLHDLNNDMEKLVLE
ncbi:reverse transcriptase domain-containing protein [Tanacetum coccineum]